MTQSNESERDERLAVLYLQLAAATVGRGPLATRDRLLLLAGRYASHASWQTEADTCRSLVLDSNPQHTIGQYANFNDALQSADYQAFDRQLQRLCPPEKAEHLAAGQSVDVELPLREPPRLVAHEILVRLGRDRIK
jgi:hypothetical protein